MKKPVVFIDTNCIDNRSCATVFLGNRSNIEKIANRADIILPKVVYDELKKHIQVYLESQLNALKRNPYLCHLDIQNKHIDALNVSDIINRLEKEEVIKFEVVDLKNKTKAYREIYNHAINGTPPFESNGDKGFKDSLIAKTIDEYIVKEKECLVFLLTQDLRLGEYFNKNKRVKIIQSYEDFDKEYTIDRFDKYLISRICEFLFDSIGLNVNINLTNQWLNWDGELIGEFNDGDGNNYIIRVDTESREPIDYSIVDTNSLLNDSINMSDLSSVRNNLFELYDVLHFLSIDQTRIVCNILLNNKYILSIGRDEDVLRFVIDFTNLLEGFSLQEELNLVREQYKLNKPQEQKEDYDF